jgi:peptidoglycan/LPS O-acetylase OafA/YrhL
LQREHVGRLPALTGLRGIAAAYVALYHAWQIHERAPGDPVVFVNTVFRYGWLGVDLFFVLSAFLLTAAILHKAPEQGPRYWLDYLRRRWIRIAPPYYASIVFALLLAGTLDYLWARPASTLLHVGYLPNVDMQVLWTINPVYWSLGVEFQFYLALPFLLWFLMRAHPMAGLSLAYVVSMAWNFAAIDLAPGADNAWATLQLPSYTFHFALGIVAARLYVQGFQVSPNTRRAAWLAAPILIFGSVIAAMPPPGTWSAISPVIGTAIVRAGPALGFALMIFLATTPGKVTSLVLANPYALALGEMSYSLYLVHLPVMDFFELRMPWTLNYGYTMFVLLLVAPAMLVTWLLYRFVERPSLTWKDRSRDSRPTPTRLPTVPKATAISVEG